MRYSSKHSDQYKGILQYLIAGESHFQLYFLIVNFIIHINYIAECNVKYKDIKKYLRKNNFLHLDIHLFFLLIN